MFKPNVDQSKGPECQCVRNALRCSRACSIQYNVKIMIDDNLDLLFIVLSLL